MPEKGRDLQNRRRGERRAYYLQYLKNHYAEEGLPRW